MHGALSDLLASGVSLFGQGSRLLKLRFGERSKIGSETLLPHKLHGEEGLSKNYCYSLECLSADAYLELKSLLGQPVEISVLLPDGGYRLLTGLVTAAHQAAADGGFAKYVLTIEPALATLTHRRNSRVFQDRTVPQIVETILAEHQASNPAFTGTFHHRNELIQTYPVRSYCLQYRESDLAFMQRLLAEEGINYRYAYGPDPATSLKAGYGEERPGGDQDASDADDADNALPQHHFILFDDNARLPASRPGTDDEAQDGRSSPANRLRFHRTAGVESADALDDWTAVRAIQAGRTQLASYDYQGVTTHVGDNDSRNRYGESGQSLTGLTAGLQDYDVPGAYYGADPDELARYTTLRQQAKDLAGKTFSGQGSARHLVPGTWFELADHPVHDQDDPEDRQFLVTALSFDAENNLTPEAKQSLGGLLNSVAGTNGTKGAATQSPPPYRNTLTAVRRHVPVVPAYTRTAHQKPTAGGLTTATVVGPEGEEIYTDEHGRIKVQFHWQRTQDHPDGGADKDDHSSTWVRVAMPSAGAAWGSQYIPRIGQEVVIDFLEGDIDRPLVTGVVYNGTHRPPTFSGVGSLPANKTLSGHKSKEYKGSRYNELLFDDSTNEIRTKLSSEHGKTQLNQGYLIHPRTEGKGETRGEGFELRTDAAGAIRAAKGLLLSAEPKGQAEGKQLDRDVLIQMLTAALSLAERLGDHAAEQQANQTETGRDNQLVDADAQSGETKTEGHQTQLKEAIDNLERGSNTDAKGTSGGGDQAGGQHVIALSGPDGVALASPRSVSVVAGTNLDQVAQRDTNQSSGRRWIHNAAESISLFVSGTAAKLKETLKITAAKGNLRMQAQDGEMDLIAKNDFRITSVDGKLILEAPKEILMMAGGGYIRIGADIEIHNPGSQSQKAAAFTLTGPDSLAAATEVPSSQLKPCKLKLAAAAESGAVGVPR